jgi:hypothetical protein
MLRSVLLALDIVPFVSGAALFTTKAVQRLGDLAAGTIVVKPRRLRAETLGSVPPARPLSPQAGMWTGRLDDTDTALLRRYMERRSELPPETAKIMLAQIADRLRAQLGVGPAEMSDEDLILAVYSHLGDY